MENIAAFMNSGVQFLSSFSIAFLLIQAINCPLAIIILVRSWRQERRLGLLVLISIITGYLVEVTQTTQAVPFYAYSEAVLMLPGQVPLGVIFTWGLILYTLFMTVRYLGLAIPVAALFAGLVATLLNLVTEHAFIALGFWEWLITGEWFGIPWDNSVGWFVLVTCLIGFHLYFWQKIPPGSKGWWGDLLATVLPGVLTAPIFLVFMTVYEKIFRPENQPPLPQTPFVAVLFTVVLLVVLSRAKQANMSNVLNPWVVITPVFLYGVSLLTLLFSNEVVQYPAMAWVMPLLVVVGMAGFLWPYFKKIGIFGPKPTTAPLWVARVALVATVALALLVTYCFVLPKKYFIGPVEIPAHDAWLPNQQFQWWYWTGHLWDEEGKEYGYQLTFFAMNSVIMQSQLAQAAVTDVAGNKFVFQEKVILRGPEKLQNGFRLTSGKDGKMKAEGGNGRDKLFAKVEPYGFELQLQEEKPVTLNYAGNAHPYRFGGYTYYYSRTKMKATGQLTVNGKKLAVQGSGWFDRQYGELLPAINQGWQWFGMELDGNRQIMLFDLLGTNGAVEKIGTLVEANGDTRILFPKDFQVKQTGEWKSPATGCTYPSGWEVTMGAERYVLEPMVKDQELHAGHKLWSGPVYWEGTVAVSGSAKGRAYVELNGFCKEQTVNTAPKEAGKG